MAVIKHYVLIGAMLAFCKAYWGRHVVPVRNIAGANYASSICIISRGRKILLNANFSWRPMLSKYLLDRKRRRKFLVANVLGIAQ